jgi:hypothetical protein
MSGRNMYVFRDGRRAVSGPGLVERLAAGLHEFSDCAAATPHDARSRDMLIDLLLRSGELECAFTDVGSPEALRLMRLTDVLATCLLGAACSRPDISGLMALVPRRVPDVLNLSPPEGFAFYALHPLDFADLAAHTPLRGGYAAIVGIRSIGTTLSAVVKAALAKAGIRAERITVRPTGHPYERRTEFSAPQLPWIAAQRANEADFLVVDEGPGMSGSSFLSVGEALLGAGVARSRVRFLCSRVPDVNTLCARDGAVRWNGFQSLYTASAAHVPGEAKVYIGGGYWRHILIGPDIMQWPASWSQMERLKFLSSDQHTIFKFEGFGRFGAAIRERETALSEAGYVPRSALAGDGFGSYPLVHGEILSRSSLSREVLEHMAQYSACRASAFRSHEEQDTADMETMLRFNVAEEFGIELNGNAGPLHAERPVLADGRMLPHEWLQARDGRLMKFDATSHGDDHFFPGPATDICWDLAGAIIEWDMPADACDYLLDRYAESSGDHPRPRLPGFLLAYTVFRMAYCSMAAAAMCGSEEEARLQQAYAWYRQRTERMLKKQLLAGSGALA